LPVEEAVVQVLRHPAINVQVVVERVDIELVQDLLLREVLLLQLQSAPVVLAEMERL
jgi:hypothetical protein